MMKTVTTESSDLNQEDLFVIAAFHLEEAEKTVSSDYSYWRSTLRTFMKKKGGMIGLFLMVLIVAFAWIQPLLPNQQRHDYSEYITDYSMWKAPPSAKHWFGTDDIGRDMWARVWEGTRISISLAFLVAVTEMVIGVVIGALWGYIRAIDRFMMELYNIVTNVPTIILLILLSFILSPGYWTMYIALAATGWLSMARFIRNQILIIRDREYNLASRCLGTPVHRMIFKNLIPHLVSVIILRLATAIPGVIASEAILTYLGIGLPLEVPSLGVLITSGRAVFNYRPHVMFFPALIISLITISFYIVGNNFSDASDPRNHT